MNTKAIGDATVAMVLARLALKGKTVLTPYGDKDRFDLVLYEDEKFSRIQCKTGRLKNGNVKFSTRSVYSYGKGKSVIRQYEGQIEFYGVYCPEINSVYLVPVSEAKTRSTRSLPLEKAKEFEV